MAKIFEITLGGLLEAKPSSGSKMLDAPDLIGPASGISYGVYTNDAVAASSAQSVEFSWSPVSGATGYILQVSEDTSFRDTTVLQSISVAGTSHTLSLARKAGVTYFWRVFAIDGAGGCSPASDTWSLTVKWLSPTIEPVVLQGDNTPATLEQLIQSGGISISPLYLCNAFDPCHVSLSFRLVDDPNFSPPTSVDGMSGTGPWGLYPAVVGISVFDPDGLDRYAVDDDSVAFTKETADGETDYKLDFDIKTIAAGAKVGDKYTVRVWFYVTGGIHTHRKYTLTESTVIVARPASSPYDVQVLDTSNDLWIKGEFQVDNGKDKIYSFPIALHPSYVDDIESGHTLSMSGIWGSVFPDPYLWLKVDATIGYPALPKLTLVWRGSRTMSTDSQVDSIYWQYIGRINTEGFYGFQFEAGEWLYKPYEGEEHDVLSMRDEGAEDDIIVEEEETGVVRREREYPRLGDPITSLKRLFGKMWSNNIVAVGPKDGSTEIYQHLPGKVLTSIAGGKTEWKWGLPTGDTNDQLLVWDTTLGKWKAWTDFAIPNPGVAWLAYVDGELQLVTSSGGGVTGNGNVPNVPYWSDVETLGDSGYRYDQVLHGSTVVANMIGWKIPYVLPKETPDSPDYEVGFSFLDRLLVPHGDDGNVQYFSPTNNWCNFYLDLLIGPNPDNPSENVMRAGFKTLIDLDTPSAEGEYICAVAVSETPAFPPFQTVPFYNGSLKRTAIKTSDIVQLDASEAIEGTLLFWHIVDEVGSWTALPPASGFLHWNESLGQYEWTTELGVLPDLPDPAVEDMLLLAQHVDNDPLPDEFNVQWVTASNRLHSAGKPITDHRATAWRMFYSDDTALPGQNVKEMSLESPHSYNLVNYPRAMVSVGASSAPEWKSIIELLEGVSGYSNGDSSFWPQVLRISRVYNEGTSEWEKTIEWDDVIDDPLIVDKELLIASGEGTGAEGDPRRVTIKGSRILFNTDDATSITTGHVVKITKVPGESPVPDSWVVESTGKSIDDLVVLPSAPEEGEFLQYGTTGWLLVTPAGAFNREWGGDGEAETVARSDHTHDYSLVYAPFEHNHNLVYQPIGVLVPHGLADHSVGAWKIFYSDANSVEELSLAERDPGSSLTPVLVSNSTTAVGGSVPPEWRTIVDLLGQIDDFGGSGPTSLWPQVLRADASGSIWWDDIIDDDDVGDGDLLQANVDRSVAPFQVAIVSSGKKISDFLTIAADPSPAGGYILQYDGVGNEWKATATNDAFNKSFGTGKGDVAEGNHGHDAMGSGNGYAPGFVPAGSGTHGDAFLRKDGTWQVPPSFSGFVIESGSGGTEGRILVFNEDGEGRDALSNGTSPVYLNEFNVAVFGSVSASGANKLVYQKEDSSNQVVASDIPYTNVVHVDPLIRYANSILYFNGTTWSTLAPTDAGKVLRSGTGGAWTLVDGVFPTTTGTSGDVLISNGTSMPAWGTRIFVPSYAEGDATKILRVNSAGNGLEWVANQGASATHDGFSDTANSTAHLMYYTKVQSDARYARTVHSHPYVLLSQAGQTIAYALNCSQDPTDGTHLVRKSWIDGKYYVTNNYVPEDKELVLYSGATGKIIGGALSGSSAQRIKLDNLMWCSQTNSTARLGKLASWGGLADGDNQMVDSGLYANQVVQTLGSGDVLTDNYVLIGRGAKSIQSSGLNLNNFVYFGGTRTTNGLLYFNGTWQMTAAPGPNQVLRTNGSSVPTWASVSVVNNGTVVNQLLRWDETAWVPTTILDMVKLLPDYQESPAVTQYLMNRPAGSSGGSGIRWR